MKDALVSVVVPVHNASPFLKECLDSITKQTYDNLEIVLVDDDSTDDSMAIMQSYASRDKRFKIYTNRDHNAALTRRKGIKESTGDYICFVDSDDIVHDKYIQRLFEAIREYGALISTVKVGPFSGEYSKKTYNDKKTTSIESNLARYFFNNYHSSGERGRYISQSITAKMFSRSSLESIDYSILKTTVLEDNWILPQVLAQLKEQQIVLVDETLYYYRINAGSTMSRVKKLTTTIQYGDENIAYSELFERAMAYIEAVFLKAGYGDIESQANSVRLRQYHNMLEWARRSQVRSEAKLKDIEGQLAEGREKCARAEVSLEEIRQSRSFRIGRLLTYPVRLLLGRK